MANWIKNLLNIEDEKIKESKNRKGTHICKYLSFLLSKELERRIVVEIELNQIPDKQYKHFMARMVPDDENTTTGEQAIGNEEVFADMATYAITDKEILSQEMMDKFKVTDTISLVRKIFPGSELFELGGEISQLSEYELPPEEIEEKKTE